MSRFTQLSIAMLLGLGLGPVVTAAQPRHSVVFSPTRILNGFFPELGVGYQHHIAESDWTVGGTLGYVMDGARLYPGVIGDPVRPARGIGGGIEVRGVVARPKEGVALSLVGSLNQSLLFTRRDFALVPTADPEIATFGATRVTGRQTELGFGLGRQRLWDTGFSFEWYVGAGLGRRGWYVPKDVQIVPSRREFTEGVRGFNRGGNTSQGYLLPRFRIGFGYCWGSAKATSGG